MMHCFINDICYRGLETI